MCVGSVLNHFLLGKVILLFGMQENTQNWRSDLKNSMFFKSCWPKIPAESQSYRSQNKLSVDGYHYLPDRGALRL